MKSTLAASLLALTIAFAPGVAVAKGCITGAIEVGTAATPGRVHSVHNRTAYMYVPPHRSIGHRHKETPEGRATTGE